MTSAKALARRVVPIERPNEPVPRARMLADALTPWTDEELVASRAPHPHVFSTDDRGLFPVGEVTVFGARGREGKTTIAVAIAAAVAVERPLAGLYPIAGRSVVIYSAEDERAQFARKVAAQCALQSPEGAERIKQRVIVPDLEAAGMESLRQLVTEADRKPIATEVDATIVEAVGSLMSADYPPTLVIFETASTLTDTDEDNRAYSVLIGCLKRIARRLRLAVVLVHHTSQASDANLRDLSITTAGIRGGTTLIYNSRQNLLLVSLGSNSDPLPSNDARTLLRNMVAPGSENRIAVLVPMETSKAADPAPIFFRWLETDYGPAALELEPPAEVRGATWRKLRETTLAQRGVRREGTRAAARQADVDSVVLLVKQLHKAGKPPTANAVSLVAGRSPTWSRPYLEQAAGEGLLVRRQETVPRVKGTTTVYRPQPDSTM